jgi:hypothetical protein
MWKRMAAQLTGERSVGQIYVAIRIKVRGQILKGASQGSFGLRRYDE